MNKYQEEYCLEKGLVYINTENVPLSEYIEHLENKLAQKEQLILSGVVKSLPTKKYEIDFGGDVLAGLEITNNEPIVIGAMNGWGIGISIDEITITEK